MMTPNGTVTISLDVLMAAIEVMKVCGTHGDIALQNALKISALGNLPLSPGIRAALSRDAQAEIPQLKTSVDQLKTAAQLLIQRLTEAATPCGPVM
ncbi:MAG: hypothetical protein ABJA98_19235 [Acidobacteriota bacterium]